MDISKYDYQAGAESGFTLTLKEPELTVEKDKKGKAVRSYYADTDIRITVLGADSKAYRKAFTAEIRRGKDEAEADVDESNARVYSKCITGWEGIEENGKPVKFSEDAAFDLLNRYRWITDQVAEAVEKRANFMTPPENS